MITLALTIFAAPVLGLGANTTDEFDSMRAKWKDLLTGGCYDLTDENIIKKINNITNTAQALVNTLNRSDTRTAIWNNLSLGSGENIYSTYVNLLAMSVAYETVGSSLYHNQDMLADILSALEWMDTQNKYSAITPQAGNWWQWQIGIPCKLNDIVIILYDEISQQQRDKYMAAVFHFQKDIAMTGANRMWECEVFAGRGIISKDATVLTQVKDGLSPILGMVTTGDGFYDDGSFVQHTTYPYTGGYGNSLLISLSKVLFVFDGSSWESTEAAMNNVYKFIIDSYVPVVYKGACMDMVRGREIAREYADTYHIGHNIMDSIIVISQFAPDIYAKKFQAIIKYWIGSNTVKSYFNDASNKLITLATNIMNDDSIVPMDEPVFYKQFYGMDRAVLARPGYGFGISMYSNRIGDYESINSENGKACNTADGMTYLYNNDLKQFSNTFWPTVNLYRLPGTTSLKDTWIQDNSVSNSTWVGGSSLFGLYGATGMDLQTVGKTLKAKKSWFMFDDEIVALGAGINSNDGIDVNTTIENRKLQAADNELIINGQVKPVTNGWTETINNANWAHLAGTTENSDIGYYFPQGGSIQALREVRSGNWHTLASSGTYTNNTENYATMWFDHGVNPENKDYSYVLLPNKTTEQTENYSTNPDIEVLENSDRVQAVKEKKLNIIGANFWKNQTATADMITCNKKASLMLKKADDQLTISVSDPTQINQEWIDIELAQEGKSVLSSNPNVVIKQLSPTIKFAVSTANAKGKSFDITFGLTDGATLTPEKDTYIIDNTDAGFTTDDAAWTSLNTTAGFYGNNFVTENTITADVNRWAKWTPDIKVADTYDVYMRWDTITDSTQKAPLEIKHAEGIDTSMDINQLYNNGVWVKVGSYPFNAGKDGYVKIMASGEGKTTADAVKLVAHNAKGNASANVINYGQPEPILAKEIEREDFETGEFSTEDVYSGENLYKKIYKKNGSPLFTAVSTNAATNLASNVPPLGQTFIAKDSGEEGRKVNPTNYFSTEPASMTNMNIYHNLDKKISPVAKGGIDPRGLIYVDVKLKKAKSNGYTMTFSKESTANTKALATDALFSFEVAKYTPSLIFHSGTTKINASKNFDFLEWNYVRAVIDLYHQKVSMYCGDSLDNLQPWEGYGTDSSYSLANQSDGLASIYFSGSCTLALDNLHIYTVDDESLPFDVFNPNDTSSVSVPVTIQGTYNNVNQWANATYNYRVVNGSPQSNGWISNGKYRFLYYPATGEIKNATQATSFAYESGYHDLPIVIPTQIEAFQAGGVNYDAKNIALYAASANYSIFRYNTTADSAIVIPEGVTSIPNNVFAQNDTTVGCQGFVLPSTLKTIGDGAFGQSSGGGLYNEIVLPEGLVSIGINSFANARFAAITLPSTLKTVGKSSFVLNKNLKYVTIKGDKVSIEDEVFKNCTSLKSITFEGKNAPSISATAFKDIISLSDCTVYYPEDGIGYTDPSFASVFPAGTKFQSSASDNKPAFRGLKIEQGLIKGVYMTNVPNISETACLIVAQYSSNDVLLRATVLNDIVLQDDITFKEPIEHLSQSVVKVFMWTDVLLGIQPLSSPCIYSE